MYTSFSVIFESVKLKRFSKKKQYQNNDDNHHFWHVYLSFDQSCPPYIKLGRIQGGFIFGKFQGDVGGKFLSFIEIFMH